MTGAVGCERVNVVTDAVGCKRVNVGTDAVGCERVNVGTDAVGCERVNVVTDTTWRNEEWRKEAADIPPSKAENDLCSTRQILALFRGQPWGDC